MNFLKIILHGCLCVFSSARLDLQSAKKPSHFLTWREGWELVYHKKVGRDSRSYDLEFPVEKVK